MANYKFKEPKNTSAYVKLIEHSQSHDEQLSIDSLIVELNSYSVGFKALRSPQEAGQGAMEGAGLGSEKAICLRDDGEFNELLFKA